MQVKLSRGDRATVVSESKGGSRRGCRVEVVAVVAVAMLAVTGPTLWVVFTRDHVNASDWASIELRTRDVLSLHPPLLGAYSRYGWSHPGPLEFYLLAIPYRLLGQGARAMQLSALVVNLVVIGVISWLLARRGRAALGAGLLSVIGTLWALPPEAIADSWNATMPILAVILTVVACWSVLLGDPPAVLVAVVAFVFVFQSHAGFGVAVGPVVVMAVVVADRRLGNDPNRWLDGALAAAGVLCIPMLIETVVDWPGNLRRLIRWSVSNDVDALGIRRSVSIIGRQTSLSFFTEPRLPTFAATVVDPLPASVGPGALLVLLALAGVAALKRRLQSELVLVGVLLVAWASAVVATATVRGPPFEWLFGWLVPLVWMTVAATGLVAWRVASAAAGRLGRTLLVASGVVAMVAAAGTLAFDTGRSNVRGDFVFADLGEPIEQLTSAALRRELDEPVEVGFAGEQSVVGGVHAGLVNQLDAHGVDVVVPAALSTQFGSHRVATAEIGDLLLVRVEGVTQAPPASAEELAVHDPLTPIERAEADALTGRLTELLEAAGLVDRVPILATPAANMLLLEDPPEIVMSARAEFDRLAALRAGGDRLVLYLVRR